jgi:hypothetical protein
MIAGDADGMVPRIAASCDVAVLTPTTARGELQREFTSLAEDKNRVDN